MHMFIRALSLLCYLHSNLLGVVEDWEADAVLNENSEILHFHHWCPEEESMEGKRRKGRIGIRLLSGF